MKEFGIKYLLIILLYFISYNSYSQNDSEFEKIIEILENYSSDETFSLNELNLMALNIEKRESYISDLKTELKNINNQISNLDNTIEKLEIELNTSKTIYKKLIYFSFLYRYEYNIFTFLVSSSNIDLIFKRIKILKLLTQYRLNIIDAIEFIKQELNFQKEILTEYSTLKSDIVTTLNKQNTILEAELNKKYVSINKLKEKNNDFHTELENKEELYEQILQYLNFNTTNVDEENLEKTKEFEENKGYFQYPIKNGIIIKEFGNYKHPVLEQVTVRNDGVDIAPSSDFEVRAVFDGLVKSIISIPGENHAILIKHGDYFTVYSNIIDIDVVANQKVTQNQILGKVPKNDEELKVINFQIWYLTEKQNPKDWLK